MKKELVLIKDLNGYWSCPLCVTHTEGKQITDVREAIKLIRNEYIDLKNAELVQENDEVFLLIDYEIPMINPGECCK
jgi:hypothetical protein